MVHRPKYFLVRINVEILRNFLSIYIFCSTLLHLEEVITSYQSSLNITISFVFVGVASGDGFCYSTAGIDHHQL